MPRPKRCTRHLFILTAALLALLISAIHLDLSLNGQPEVRLDSGDRRQRGLVFWLSEPPIPGRELIISASNDLGIPAEWCAVRQRSHTFTDAARHLLYSRIPFWLEAEPPLGKRLLADVADYFANPSKHDGFPSSTRFLNALKWNEQASSYELDPHWIDRTSPAALQFALDEIAYTPDPNGPLAPLLLPPVY